VTNSTVRTRFSKIAQRFQFLDRGFAEYFQHGLHHTVKGYVKQRLAEIRVVLTKRRISCTNASNQTSYVELGDLGNFCERVCEQWDGYDEQTTSTSSQAFSSTNVDTDADLHYLQDALEVHYWRLILNVFLMERGKGNSGNFIGEIVLSVLNNIRLSVIDEKRRLVDGLKGQGNPESGEIDLIIKGIDQRLKILESALDRESWALDQ
jgi:hypothetical protein